MKKLTRKTVALLLSTAAAMQLAVPAFAEEVVMGKNAAAVTEETQQLIDARPKELLRRMENLDRGLVASKTGTGVFLSWRWLATESKDVLFNVYRDGELVNVMPLNATSYTDPIGTVNNTYTVTTVINGVESEPSKAVKPNNENYLQVPVEQPAPWVNDIGQDTTEYKYAIGDMSTGDLDGDGEYDLVIKWDAIAKDNSQSGITSPTILSGYKLDGTKLWDINLGINIRAGAHYTQFMVYDLDGDGSAEVVCKTAPGSVDGKGEYVTKVSLEGAIKSADNEADYRNPGGYILTGPEYLTVFSGKDGAAVDTVYYNTDRGDLGSWGDTYGNRVDRFLACIAYLNGETPAVVMTRGYYGRTTLDAYEMVDGRLKLLWNFDSSSVAYLNTYAGRGNHGISVADVDYDGCDEIIFGSSLYDNDGAGVYPGASGTAHGDAQHTGDLIPDRPGLETFSVHESGSFKFDMRDTRTGEMIWYLPGDNNDIGRGASDDVDPRYPGAESWAAGFYVTSTGEALPNPGFAENFFIYWDGDLGREIQNSNMVYELDVEKNRPKVIFTAQGHSAVNGSKSTPCLNADILGDWREETIYPSPNNNYVRIYTTTTPTDYRIYTLMHDPVYRAGVAWQNVAYNQPPHTGFYLGYDTQEVPVPYIYVNAADGSKVTSPELSKGSYALNELKAQDMMVLKIGSEKALLNGKTTRIDNTQGGITPIILDGRTLVPVRFISESFGCEVQWDEATQLVVIKDEDTEIRMILGKNVCSVNGEKVTLDVPAQSIGGRTMIPLRAMADSLGKQVFWSGAHQLICIADDVSGITDEKAASLTKMLDDAATPEIVYATPILSDADAKKGIEIVSVTATGDDGNPCQNAIDGDLNTRWSEFNDEATLTLTLKEESMVSGVAMAHWKGDERKYEFSILYSIDGTSWNNAISSKSSAGDTLDRQIHKFNSPVKAKYIRFIGTGSAQNNCSHISEIVVMPAE